MSESTKPKSIAVGLALLEIVVIGGSWSLACYLESHNHPFARDISYFVHFVAEAALFCTLVRPICPRPYLLAAFWVVLSAIIWLCMFTNSGEEMSATNPKMRFAVPSVLTILTVISWLWAFKASPEENTSPKPFVFKRFEIIRTEKQPDIASIHWSDAGGVNLELNPQGDFQQFPIIDSISPSLSGTSDWLSARVENRNLILDFSCSDGTGFAAMKDSVMKDPPPGWDMNQDEDPSLDGSAMEIVDGQGRPIVQFIRNKKNDITIRGLFAVSPFEGAAFAPNLAKVGSVPLGDLSAEYFSQNLRPIFKYPSKAFSGVRAEIATQPSTQSAPVGSDATETNDDFSMFVPKTGRVLIGDTAVMFPLDSNESRTVKIFGDALQINLEGGKCSISGTFSNGAGSVKVENNKISSYWSGWHSRSDGRYAEITDPIGQPVFQKFPVDGFAVGICGIFPKDDNTVIVAAPNRRLMTRVPVVEISKYFRYFSPIFRNGSNTASPPSIDFDQIYSLVRGDLHIVATMPMLDLMTEGFWDNYERAREREWYDDQILAMKAALSKYPQQQFAVSFESGRNQNYPEQRDIGYAASMSKILDKGCGWKMVRGAKQMMFSEKTQPIPTMVLLLRPSEDEKINTVMNSAAPDLADVCRTNEIPINNPDIRIYPMQQGEKINPEIPPGTIQILIPAAQ